MSPVETYLAALWAIRGSGAAVPETSGYGPLAALLDAIGARLSPRVRCIIGLRQQGAGLPDAGFFTERLWRSVKYEEVYLADYGSPREARLGLARYLTFYNTERPHQALAYRRPADLYHG